MKVGLILPLGDEPRPGVPASYAELLAMVRQAEAGGLDSLWVYDHLISVSPDGAVEGTWEAWTTLAALAAATNRVTLGTMVSCTGFRHPAVTAKAAHTVAEISADRLVLGLGAGWHEPEYEAFGFPFDHRVDRFEESLRITASLLRDGRATFAGRYYQVKDAPLLPVRSSSAVPPILIGCGGGARMLGLVARHADAWNTAWYGLPGPKFRERRDALFAACAEHGREPASVEVTVGMLIGGSSEVPAVATGIAEALAAWRDEGVAHVIAYPDPTDTPSVAALIDGYAHLR